MRMDAHVTKADFVRNAIREKLKRDTPVLYRSMFTSESPYDSEDVTIETRARDPRRSGQ